ncbi:methionine aminopeptidase [Candidatus Termititenax persephonae]|uniref:Methionine aminopeptidase n=1 Tax=Candidatus Termititenax persephonae TaxID=2218525 RepID=A0A388TJB0_9BACT|nr:methionine aminopeptidase [Candidatus Termititenax persephonae]
MGKRGKPVAEGQVILKSEYEIMKMAEAGQYNALFFRELGQYIKAGLSTMDLEDFACAFCAKHGLFPTFKAEPGYHWALCVSINEEVVHGIPTKQKIIQDGDIVSVDIGVTLDGYIGDSCYTYLIGNVAPPAKKLCDATRESLDKAIKIIRPGATIGDIGHAIQSHVEPLGFSVVREYVGHGVGTRMHEPPSIPHYGQPGTGLVLQAGMVIAVEPMINAGGWETEVLKDHWTVVTKDRQLSAQYEHTIAVVPGGCRVLTSG